MQLEEIIAKELAGLINDHLHKYFREIDARLAAVETRKPEKGEPGRDGKDGRDGAPGPPGPSGIDGKDGAGPSRGRHRGPWTGSEQYHQDDTVSSGGSGWIAIVEGATGRPGDSKDWQLFVKKGRDGKDGDRGPQGPTGPAGKDYYA